MKKLKLLLIVVLFALIQSNLLAQQVQEVNTVLASRVSINEDASKSLKNQLPIVSNPLKTREDVVEAVRQLCEPIKPYFSEGKALLKLGETGTVYPEKTAQMEGFARLMWGLTPLFAGGEETDLFDTMVEGLINGTDPTHEEYWGDLGNVDQLAVEMPPIAFGFCLIPDKLWKPLTEIQRDNVFNWFNKTNHNEVADNNWLFFPIFVNIAFKKLNLPYNQKLIDEHLDMINEFYLGDGWSSDGNDTDQRDYYSSFAIQYYSMIYSVLMKKEDPERAAIFKERAKLFAKDFIYWFTPGGTALPFGRSLTYRFAQCGFWGACAYASIEALDWGVMKGLYLRNLRWWLSQPIFDNEGILSIGYRYPNLLMAEYYNSPGSPYWAFKAFLPLALPEDHPFWAAEEQPMPALIETTTQKHPYMVMMRNDKQNELVALTSGQWAGFGPTHNAAKYSKFAYSTTFGFSVSSESTSLSKGAFDSMLALSEDGNMWRVRTTCESVEVEENVIISRWKPWDNVEIKTWLIAANPWHVRVHKIKTGRPLLTAEGGFAIANEITPAIGKETWQVKEDNAVFCDLAWGTSGLINLKGNTKSEIIEAVPNTNLMNNRTAIPTLTSKIKKGDTTYLISAVIASTVQENIELLKKDAPKLIEEDGEMKIKYQGKVIYTIK